MSSRKHDLVRNVVAGCTGRLAKHLVECLGDRSTSDPVVRDLVEQYLTWYSMDGEVQEGSVKYMVGTQIWDAVTEVAGPATKEDTTMTKRDILNEDCDKSIGDSNTEFANTNLSPEELNDEGRNLDLDTGYSILDTGCSVQDPVVTLRDLVKTRTYGKGHDFLMRCLGVAADPDSDKTLEELFRRFWSMWQEQASTGWREFYVHCEDYLRDHGVEVATPILRSHFGDQDTLGSPRTRPEVPGRTGTRRRSSKRSGVRAVGQAVLNGTVGLMESTSTALVGTVIPGIVSASIKGSTRGVIHMEDTIHASRVEYNKAWLKRESHSKLPDLKAKVEAVKASRKVPKVVVQANLDQGVQTTGDPESQTTGEELPL